MRILPLTATIAIAISCSALSHSVSGQTIGTLIGANIATISNADRGIASVVGGAFDKKKRVGLKAGVYLTIPLAGMFSLQPEVFYAQNGVRIESPAGTNLGSFDVDLGYVEVPLLLRIDVAAKSPIHPILLAGASGAYRVQCKLSASTSVSTLAQDCNANSGSNDPFKKSDYSVVGGAGLAAKLGGVAASLQLRFSQGLTSIASADTDTTKPKNRALSVLLGFTF